MAAILNKTDPYQYVVPGDITSVWNGQKNLNIFGKVHYGLIVRKAYSTIRKFYRKALRDKECYIGPFKGEFGHLLLHNLPFLTHLYKQGVKIHYCGMLLHEPFLRAEGGKSMIHEWFPLRDFFAEIKPVANSVKPPADVQVEIDRFKKIASSSGKAFLDLGDDNLYWYVFRNWELNGRQAIFDFSKIYDVKKENAVTIFPRKKGGAYTPNNGGAWDYQELAETIAPYFDRVYITGHPSMSEEMKESGNICLRLSTNNEDIIKSCLASKLIITQHSGAVHLGAYTNSDVLIIFKGELPIKGLRDTLRFRKNLTNRPLNFAFNMEEIVQFVKQFVQ